MKLESQITNNHSSLIYNQSKRRSTPVENIRQITPYLKKQTQFQKCKMMQMQYIQGITKNIAASGHEKTNPISRKDKKKKFLLTILFPLTLSPKPDYNGTFSQISCLQRTPIERSWK
ncbi:MAG: hypothetical protein GY845_24610 [Planctomycetes bacterium]|nr:hypothetical protein [Planctomycetota bacterium]